MNANTILAFRGGSGRNQIAPLPTTGTAGNLATAAAARLYSDTTGTFNYAILAVPLQTAIIGSSNPLDINTNGAILGPAYGRMFGTPRGSQSPYFNSASFDGVPFRLRVSGVATMGANGAQSLLVNIIHGPATTIAGAGNTTIASTGAALATVAGGAANFSIVAELLWDSTLGYISGRQSSVISFVTPSTQVQSDVVLAAEPACASAALLQFQVFVTAGNGAASLVQIKEFALEAI
jgi:hypothetical protein